MRHDVAIVGGGIVGLATALALSRRAPGLKLVILEKEHAVGTHQTGRNSGVLHAGLYYRPGSLKARLCVEGKRRMEAFCQEHGVPYERCGKVVVATEERELPVLQQLFERGSANGVPGLELIGPGRLRELEPEAAGLAALYSPGTGIVDFRQVAAAMARLLAVRGVQVLTGARVLGVRRSDREAQVETTAGAVACRLLVNCAGLYSDVVARLAGDDPGVRIVPFRGEYYLLRPERRGLVRNLIYPVPDPALPFLGVHFTRMVSGEVEAGPNAVLALAREGYSWGRLNARELWGTLRYAGFRAVARRYWRTGLYEMWRSLSQRAFVASLRRLVPAVTTQDVVRGGAGVRAQAVAPDGRLLDDFHIVEAPRAVHVLNAPSPAATSSLAIGDYVADIVARRLQGDGGVAGAASAWAAR